MFHAAPRHNFAELATAAFAILSFFFTCCLTTPCLALRIVTYNTANSGDNNLPSLPRERMGVVLQGIGEEVVEGISRPIDVLLLQEQDSLTTTTQAIVDTLNEIYGEEVYARGRRTGRTNGGGRGAIIYNTQTVELVEEASFGTLSVRAQSRETMRYLLRPIGYGDDAIFAAYVNHYKAGATATDRTRRNVEANALRTNADSLALSNETSHMIFAGDFNIQRCTEAMYETLTLAGPAQAIDPVNRDGANCNWHNNSSLRQLHTQSPVDSGATGFLARGGMDDRFDFQLVTAAMIDGEGVSLIPNTYRSFGNNGTHRLNQPINDIQNTGASRSVLNALARTSDHLPVVADYQIPAWMSVNTSLIPERIIQGANYTLDVEVANVAPVTSSIEADELDFMATLDIDIAGTDSQVLMSEVNATSMESFEFSLPTDELRTRVFRLRVESDSEAVVDGVFQTSGAYSVIAPARPSWSASADETTTTVDLGIIGLDQNLTYDLKLYNLQQAANGAAIEVELADATLEDWLSWADNSLDLIQVGSSSGLEIHIDGRELGSFEQALQLTASDDRSIFGAIETTMFVVTTGTVAIPGDSNVDGRVAFDDFLTVSQNFGSEIASWETGDFDRDGSVQFGDFLMLSRNFGRTVSIATVPEATGFQLLAFAMLFAAVTIRRSEFF